MLLSEIMQRLLALAVEQESGTTDRNHSANAKALRLALQIIDKAATREVLE